ncbi:SdpI family protein [Nanoarchaeota archaeon]
MNRTNITTSIIIIITLAITIFYYPQLPDPMATHWNSAGQPDGSMSRFWGASLMPIVLLGMLLLFMIIPKIDPLKNNIAKFRKHFDRFIILMFLFMMAMQILVIAWNTGHKVNFNRIMPVMMAILLFYIGVMVSHAKRNWFIGIRTPWTLSSDTVWDKTHKLGAKLFYATAVLALIGAFTPPPYPMYFILIPVLTTTAIVLVYSYTEFQKEQKKEKTGKKTKKKK